MSGRRKPINSMWSDSVRFNLFHHDHGPCGQLKCLWMTGSAMITERSVSWVISPVVMRWSRVPSSAQMFSGWQDCRGYRLGGTPATTGRVVTNAERYHRKFCLEAWCAFISVKIGLEVCCWWRSVAGSSDPEPSLTWDRTHHANHWVRFRLPMCGGNENEV